MGVHPVSSKKAPRWEGSKKKRCTRKKHCSRKELGKLVSSWAWWYLLPWSFDGGKVKGAREYEYASSKGWKNSGGNNETKTKRVDKLQNIRKIKNKVSSCENGEDCLGGLG